MTKSKQNERLGKLGAISHAEWKDKSIGEIGTKDRDKYEGELKIELLGEFLKKIRNNQHLTQEEVAKQMGFGKSYISKIENDIADLTISILSRYLQALDMAKLSIRIEDKDGHPEELVIF
jgi:DNA-binding XRE family transcriptional regulator